MLEVDQTVLLEAITAVAAAADDDEEVSKSAKLERETIVIEIGEGSDEEQEWTLCIGGVDRFVSLIWLICIELPNRCLKRYTHSSKTRQFHFSKWLRY
jgi:hypothetical protein